MTEFGMLQCTSLVALLTDEDIIKNTKRKRLGRDFSSTSSSTIRKPKQREKGNDQTHSSCCFLTADISLLSSAVTVTCVVRTIPGSDPFAELI